MALKFDSSNLDLVREHFVLPLLTKDQYTSTGDSKNPSDLQRAMWIVDDLVTSSFENENDHPLCISRLNEVLRKQLFDALVGVCRIEINEPDEAARYQIMNNILGAVFHATENWELAHVITPFLGKHDDANRENLIRFYIRKKLRDNVRTGICTPL